MSEETSTTLVEIPEGFTFGYRKDGWLGFGAWKQVPNVVLRTDRKFTIARTGLSLLVGLNGKGKTTFLKYLCGALDERPPVKIKTTYLPEELSFGSEMSSECIIECILGRGSATMARDFIQRFELDSKKPYGALSKGNKQKLRLILSFALSENHKSDLLALDEPLSGLDYQLRAVVWSIMEEMSSRRQVLASLHPDRIKVAPSAVFGVSGNGLLSILDSPVPQSWEEIESQLGLAATAPEEVQ